MMNQLIEQKMLLMILLGAHRYLYCYRYTHRIPTSSIGKRITQTGSGMDMDMDIGFVRLCRNPVRNRF